MGVGSTTVTWQSRGRTQQTPQKTPLETPTETHGQVHRRSVQHSPGLVWWYNPVISALGRSWPDWQVMDSLCCTMRPCLKQNWKFLKSKRKETTVLWDSRHVSTQQMVQLIGPRTNKTSLRWEKPVKTALESELNGDSSRVMRHCISIGLLAT